MSKYLPHRTARIMGWIGIALVVVSFCTPARSAAETLTYYPGMVLCLLHLMSECHLKGYEKGHRRGYLRAKKDFEPRTWPRVTPAHPRVPNALEAELNQGLAAMKADTK